MQMAPDLSNHSDAELCALVRTGDRGEEAFRELYERLAPRVFRYCKRVLGNHEIAEDVFQETFTRFYTSIRQPREMSNVVAFILKIARNLALNVRNSKHYGLEPIEHTELFAIPAPYDRKELLDLIAAAVERLSVTQRELFVLREYNGLSYADIAEILDMSEAQVKIGIFRARHRIRTILAPYLADLAV